MSVPNILINLGKSIKNLFGDAWGDLRNFFNSETFQAFGPYIVGGLGVITCFMEGIKGLKEAYSAYQNERIGQRKTRILTSALIALSAGAGIGLATTLMVAAAGVAISIKTSLMAPVLIPSLFTSIYSMVLWRKSYIFHRARQEQALAKLEYEQALRSLDAELHEYQATPDEIELKKRRYEDLREKRLRAECLVAFSIMEVATSMMVVIATILGTSAFFASSAVSFGLIPAAILAIGLVAGYLAQGFEYYDKKHNFAYTRDLRKGIVALGQGIKNALTACAHFLGISKPEPIKSPLVHHPSSSLHRKLLNANLIELVPLKQACAANAGSALEVKKGGERLLLTKSPFKDKAEPVATPVARNGNGYHRRGPSRG